jgi:hypothetical protein
MNSSSECGKRCSYILFECSMLSTKPKSMSLIVGPCQSHFAVADIQFLPRFRMMPTFGADTIRRFSRNVSEIKKMAARDFEDLLQVCFAVLSCVIHSLIDKCAVCHPCV